MPSRITKGENHKKEPILKIMTPECPLCGEYMIYSEFLFDIQRELNSETDKLVRIQQIEEILARIDAGKRIEFVGILFGCPTHYLQIPKQRQHTMQKKPYITLDAEDVWYVSNTPISHIYIAMPIR